MKFGIHWFVLASLACFCLGSTPGIVNTASSIAIWTDTVSTSAWSTTTTDPSSTDTTTQSTVSSSTDDTTTSTQSTIATTVTAASPTSTTTSPPTSTTTSPPISTSTSPSTSPQISTSTSTTTSTSTSTTTSTSTSTPSTTPQPTLTSPVPSPILNNMSRAVTLNVHQNQDIVLEYINCTDPSNLKVIVSLDSVSPTTGACYRCFTIIPCGDPVWCLRFISTIGSLDIRNTPIYYLSISCSNLITETKLPLQVRLTTNSPPVFLNGTFASHKVYNTKNLGSGAIIYTVKANDSDGDTLRYNMPPTSDNGNFQIGESDGVISATDNLSKECRSSVTFQVYVSDGINKQVGPMVISVIFYDINKAPSITNLDATIQVPEDKPRGASIYKIEADDENQATVTYTLTSPNSQAMAFFNITGQDILLVSKLDFENPIAGGNRIVLSVTAKDKEGCSSGMKTLYVSVTNVNEAPTLEPSSWIEMVNEGFISFRPPWSADDPDGDPTRYSINGSQSQFSIDRNTGEIKSIGDYDVDTNKKYTVDLTIQLTDSSGLFDQSVLTIRIVDINDNRPVISPPTLALSATECMIVGDAISNAQQRLSATDADSSYQGNSATYFISQPSKFFTVWSNGDVVLTAPIRAGEYSTATVVASDQGQFPGPLQSSPALVTVRGIPCPTTTIRTTPTTITTTMTTQLTMQNTTALPLSPRDTWSENLPWITTSALLGTCWLGLLALMGCRYLKKPSFTRFSSPKKSNPTKPTNVKPAPEQANYSKPEINIQKPEATISQKMPTVSTQPKVTGAQDEKLFDFWTNGSSFT